MSEIVTYYNISEDGVFDYESIGDVIDALSSDHDENELVGIEYYSCDFKQVDLTEYLDVSMILNNADEYLYDNVGNEDGDFDFYTSVSEDAKKELKSLLNDWCKKHVKGVAYEPVHGSLKTLVVTKEDL